MNYLENYLRENKDKNKNCFSKVYGKEHQAAVSCTHTPRYPRHVSRSNKIVLKIRQFKQKLH